LKIYRFLLLANPTGRPDDNKDRLTLFTVQSSFPFPENYAAVYVTEPEARLDDRPQTRKFHASLRDPVGKVGDVGMHILAIDGWMDKSTVKLEHNGNAFDGPGRPEAMADKRFRRIDEGEIFRSSAEGLRPVVYLHRVGKRGG
jgi:hypothetical protein